ncbi:urease accessory protein UreD [Spiractinospora alimapuensis]|uniref:urease accessory protein UreD n=1 Tax=Spiractinospora alimapuensis TaxID=2820884 RepID=UPI001F2A3D29|nr:urease accessory protein UreD [Spiractinospora alimapuensis]QVQ51966.1 urease accessory protein UreD [Spiractinospora alimapuensis]
MTAEESQTSIVVESVGGRARAAVLEGGAHLRPRLVELDGTHARIALVAVCATLLAGDHIRLTIAVGPGVTLELLEPSGTVAYDARGGRASWHTSVRLAENAGLLWRGAPFVVADGADVSRHTALDLHSGARALVAETVVLGRSGEQGGALRTSTHARYGGRDLLVEDVDLRHPATRADPGMLADARVLATTTLVGAEETTPRSHETRLPGPGALARALTREAHTVEAALNDTWNRWRGHVTTATVRG